MNNTNYPQSSDAFPIVGKLSITERKVHPVGASVKRLYSDNDGKLYAKIFGYWWKFPEQIEY